MNRCRWSFSAIPILLVAALAAPRIAGATTIDVSWNVCSPIVVDRTVAPGDFEAFWVSVTGHAQPHRGYEFWISVGDESNAAPDAWRFDVGGCQGPDFIAIQHISPALSKGCPSFQGTLQTTQVKAYELAPAHLNLPSGMAVIHLANTYSFGSVNTSTVNPASRYYLGQIVFSHERSVPGIASEPGTCGGLEHGMCFRLLPEHCNWLNEAGEQVSFEIGNVQVTANGGCGVVPAENSTWGHIKVQYRR